MKNWVFLFLGFVCEELFDGKCVMTKQQAIGAILTPPQLEAFCKRFDVRVGDIEPNFSGWSKHILMTKEYVFLFPRHPEYEKGLETELQVYKMFANFESVPLPKLVDVVYDREISYYRFGVVTRMPGVIFSSVELSLEPNGYEQVLCGLGQLTAIWHQMPLKDMKETLKPVAFDPSWEEAEFYQWLCPALVSDTVNKAWEEICALSVKVVQTVGGGDFERLTTEDSWAKWRAVLVELANLSPVLLHRDVHEDQFFVRSEADLKITGLIDWGTAAIGNPVLDFNFGEWGVDIWRYRDRFGQFRRTMWQAYLEARDIQLSTYDGLHLFYTLQELHWAATQNKASAVYHSLEEEFRAVLTRLLDVTVRIPSASSL